ncbi:MAG: hypothetical protein RIT27_908 [Pseudomonadota bacterium]|jgi:uncharacterized protein (TIGR02099 family)
MLKVSRFLLHAVWRVLFLSLLTGCLFIALVYFAFWQLEQQRDHLTAWLANILEQPVTLQMLKPNWKNANPQIQLEQLQIGKHQLHSATVELDLFSTILVQKPIIKYINLNGLNITIPTSTNTPPLLNQEIIQLAQKIDPFISQTHLYLENTTLSNADFSIKIAQAEWIKYNKNYILSGKLEQLSSNIKMPFKLTKGLLDFNVELNPESLETNFHFLSQQAHLQLANQTTIIPSIKTHLQIQWQQTPVLSGQINIPTLDPAILSAFNSSLKFEGFLKDININIIDQFVTAQFQGHDLVFSIKNLYDDEPLKIKQLQTNLVWNSNPQFEITLSNEDISNLQITGTFDNWQLDIKNAQTAAIYRYVPQTAKGARQWLTHGLSSGIIKNAQAIWKNHQFTADAQLIDTTINYAENWGEITKANANVIFKDNALTINAHSGRIADSQISPTTQVVIHDLISKKPLLTVDGQVNGNSAAALQFIHKSPLDELLDLQGLNLKGEMTLNLKLTIPLTKNGGVETEGLIYLKNNQLSNELLRKKDLSLTHLTGEIYFDNDGLYSEELNAKLLEYPIQLEINKDEENGLQIDLQGKADRVFLDCLFKRINPQFSSFLWYLSGQTDWQAKILYPSEEKPSTLEITSHLNGAAIILPEPFGKKAEQNRLLRYVVPLEKKGHGLFQYGNIFNGKFSADMKQGVLQFGEKLASLDNQIGWKVAGTLPKINLEQWTFLTDNKPIYSSNNLLPKWFFDVYTPSLTFVNQHWQNVYLKGDLEKMTINADKIAGKINYSDDILKIDLERLFIDVKNDKKQQDKNILPLKDRDTVNQIIRFDPRELPELQVKCRELKINDLNLGIWRFQTTSSEEGLTINKLQAQVEHLDIEANGSWKLSPQLTSLQIQLQSDNFGHGLKQLGYKSGAISGGKVRANFQGNFPGDPLQFDRGYLEGILDLNISKGRLEDIEPGAGRFFGLFDLYAAPRRLFLDFGDVLGTGLEFENIGGQFQFAEGFAETKGLLLESTMSNVLIQGKTDLRRHLYDQTMIVMPHIANTLSVISLALGGVGLKAMTLLLQSMLKEELNQIIQFRYKITESWEKPRIEMIDE